MKTFAPGALDSDETIRSKLQRMDEFFNSAQDEIGQGRGAAPIGKNNPNKQNPYSSLSNEDLLKQLGI
jgi:hypothetical protein